MPTLPLHVPEALVEETLEELRAAGRRRQERVVLWLGTRSAGGTQVSRMLVPRQDAAEDRFWVEEDEIRDLLATLATERLFVAAQVHSHPGAAYHSEADDEWAIVRHEDAVSIVIPTFASNTNRETFLEDAAIYLQADGEWCYVPPASVADIVRFQS